MLALLFVLLATLIGALLVRLVWRVLWAPTFERSLRSQTSLPLPEWVIFWPASWVLGTLVFGWTSFLWAESARSIVEGALGVLVSGALILTVATLWSIRVRGWRATLRELPRPRAGVEIVYAFCALLLAVFICLRTFSVEDGALRIGVTVFSDFGPHLAVIRSFSEGVNFPPQYPYFPDGTMRYHFMFQFHVATLEALGLRLDWAFNIPSILALVACLLLLHALAVAITGSRTAGLLAGALFVFRSSFAVFTHAAAQWSKPDFWQAFWNPSVHIGMTTNESWGLFAQSVYANQRHFAFALAVLWLVLIAVLPLLRARVTAPATLAAFTHGSANWLPETWLRPLALGLLLGAIGYWNGAVVLAALMILFGIAIVARHRLEFALIAALALGLSAWQWASFAGPASASPEARWFFGFLAEDKTPSGVILYYLELLGLFVPIVLWAALVAARVERGLLMACLLPLVFATTVALTVDINANHKFVMISVALANIFIAALLVELFRQPQLLPRSIAAASAGLLMGTGIVDLRTLQVMNRNALLFRFDDPTLAWVRRETAPGTIFLTHWASLNPVLLAGRPIYYGWPYYAWSAGHPTADRETHFRALYSGSDPAGLLPLARTEGIDYIVIDWENRGVKDYLLNEPVIAATFPLVFQHPERDVRIYRVPP